ncbi:protein N-terminal asparagine amidohydrolase isoform X1 [Cucurbita pepo subsp. pepo]|uniref:protein N-terminal asparagine amidohydrolase isoform X1 n=2 Tax=Cucurbita pepo subsp. pepo TaxID=3664 RepID=UPI000C9D5031|nr:protein N-terminal asparagine amidohydrolase isoform X1 [Cucurbita pepo subsp. pepo]
MIFVDGVPFTVESSSSNKNCVSEQGADVLYALMECPFLVDATKSFKSIPEMRFTDSEQFGVERSTMCKWVYLFQKEYATVDPALVDFVGTDEATTCVGVAIRNRKNGMTSVAHIDFPNIIENALSQMLSLVVDPSSDAELDVHLVGGFEDVLLQESNDIPELEDRKKTEGHSFPLCNKIIECLWTRPETFHLQTLCVLHHNTWRDSEGNAYPIFSGFSVKTSDGSVFPASFDSTSRCPDEVIRRIRLSSSYEDPSLKGRLLETYETHTDQFKIEPCCWSPWKRYMALSLQQLSDAEILQSCSTSPSAEAPDFVENSRRQWAYLVEHSDWRESFPKKKPRIFRRAADGKWERSFN